MYPKNNGPSFFPVTGQSNKTMTGSMGSRPGFLLKPFVDHVNNVFGNVVKLYYFFFSLVQFFIFHSISIQEGIFCLILTSYVVLCLI